MDLIKDHPNFNQAPFIKKYIEIYFSACFEEVFPYNGASWETNLNGNEILKVLELLEIPFDRDYLIEKYIDKKNHNTEVFHSTKNPIVFAYFDLYKDPTDQNDMFYFGINYEQKDDAVIFQALLDIYKKLNTSSPFCCDIWNKQLYNKVFKSSFYFYKDNNTQPNRMLVHHNLPKYEI